MSNLGLWDRWYAPLTEPQPYAETETYAVAAEWVEPCALVEDWGCGKGWMRRHIPAERYRGLDGSRSPFADEVVDLAAYRSSVPGIVIRHVLEHDYRWHLILENALASVTERIALVLYTPPVGYTRQIDFEDDPGVPVLAFRHVDLTDRFSAAGVAIAKITTHPSPAAYGRETVIRGER